MGRIKELLEGECVVDVVRQPADDEGDDHQEEHFDGLKGLIWDWNDKGSLTLLLARVWLFLRLLSVASFVARNATAIRVNVEPRMMIGSAYWIPKRTFSKLYISLLLIRNVDETYKVFTGAEQTCVLETVEVVTS